MKLSPTPLRSISNVNLRGARVTQKFDFEDLTLILTMLIGHCYFQASTGNCLYISLRGLEDDTLRIGVKYKNNRKGYSFTEYKKSSRIYFKQGSTIIYYEPKKKRKNGYVLVSMYPIHHRTDGPDL